MRLALAIAYLFSSGAARASGAPSADDSQREAVKHWTNGIVFFQKGQTDKARTEWSLCLRVQPGNADCSAGLKRLDAKGAKGARPKRPSARLRPQAGFGQSAGAGEANKRAAIEHWTKGIVAYQKRDMAKARDEWTLCGQLDPDNTDCPIGLQKIDDAHGRTP